jgi:hypothetical protein
MDVGFSPEVSRRILELHLNDAFMNVLDVTITGSGKRSKPRVFTQLCHIKTPSSMLYIRLAKPATSSGGGGRHATAPPTRPETPVQK